MPQNHEDLACVKKQCCPAANKRVMLYATYCLKHLSLSPDDSFSNDSQVIRKKGKRTGEGSCGEKCWSPALFPNLAGLTAILQPGPAPQPSSHTTAPDLNTASMAQAPSVGSFPNWRRRRNSSNQGKKCVGRSLWSSKPLLRA